MKFISVKQDVEDLKPHEGVKNENFDDEKWELEDLRPPSEIKTEIFEDDKSLIKPEKPTIFCNTCKKVFKHKTYLENHLATRHPSKNPKVLHCKFCNARFAFKSSIRKHFRKVHEGKDIAEGMLEEVIKSEYGNYSEYGTFKVGPEFETKREQFEKFNVHRMPNAYDEHITYVPEAEMPYQCKLCEKVWVKKI